MWYADPAVAQPPSNGEAPTANGASPAARYAVAAGFFPERTEPFTLPEPYERCTVTLRMNLSDAQVRELEADGSILHFVQAVLTAWNLVDADGAAIPCTPEAIEACLPADVRSTIWWEWRERRNSPLQLRKLLASGPTSPPNAATSTSPPPAATP